MYFISRYSKLTEVGLQLPGWVRWLLSGVVLLGIIGIWYVGVFSPLSYRLLECSRRENKLKEQQAVLNGVTQRAHQLEALVNAQKAAWQTQVQSAQQQASHDSLFALFDTFGKQGIAIQAYYPRGSIDRSWCTKSTVQLQFLASFDQLLRLFDALNKDTAVYQWQQLRLERRDKQIFAVATLSHKTPQGDGNDKA